MITQRKAIRVLG